MKDRECLSPDEEVPSKTVILLGFLWGSEWNARNYHKA